MTFWVVVLVSRKYARFQGRELLTAQEVCDRLKISRSTLFAHRAEWKLEMHRPSPRIVRYFADTVDAHIARHSGL